MEITILLVDDEAIDLEWLQVRVESGNYDGLRVVGAAKSGFAALAAMERERIDMILTDIRMPIMSGMEFARKAKEIQPDVRIVFISGHDDFQYAKEAIQLHAYDYLLKPVDDDDLEKTLTGLCAKIREERRSRSAASEALPYVKRELLLRWFREASPNSAEDRVSEFLAPCLREGAAVALIEPDDRERLAKEMPLEERRALWARVESFLADFAQSEGLGEFMNGFNDRFILLVTAADEAGASLDKMIFAFRKAFPFTITIGLGDRAYRAEDLHASYRQAETALSIKWLVGKDRVIRDASSRTTGKPAAADTERLVQAMLQAMLEYDLVKIDDCLQALFSPDGGPLRKSEAYDLIVRITSKLHGGLQLLNENLYELLNWEAQEPVLLFEFETMADLVSWLRRRFFELSELLITKRRKQDRKLIAAIIGYMEERLAHKVTLREVATHFDFTPNYLGYLFKEETGMTFSDYINDVRIKKARVMLDDPLMKIYEISDKVGYNNVIYFNRMFKQAMGMTPGEYRKKNKI
ncbi:response regulator [Paenibacillus sacheonensis]|uniref:Response regulator n=1 Tax=Paenibacillus sacheonensis TaxID=742054 RepID=A0A7X4YJM0_9BACL|nr:response regulator [Paenibacillus sacheonensis]MBM7564067.1 two-component system response regulator YesN [Paenibacillus sacheonensis]NBC67601.1 response regulator [Paenibacillus sacheonensis]